MGRTWSFESLLSVCMCCGMLLVKARRLCLREVKLIGEGGDIND
jgi:hypothetical protein